MNIRLKYSLDWRAGIWFDDRLQMNNYSATLSLLTKTNNQAHQIVAISRLKWFVYRILESTVFVKQTDTDTVRQLAQIGISVTTLPEDPIDQVVGLMLFAKFNSIMEDHIQVTELDLVSDLGDSVHYLHSDNENTVFDFGTGWWHASDPSHCLLPKLSHKNIVKLNRVPVWKDFDLDWDTDTAETSVVVTNTVVKFRKDEN